MAAEYNPLVGPAPQEVPLLEAPLVRVIAQVRFSPILSVERADFIAPFQEQLRATYPVLHHEHAQNLRLNTEGVASGERQVAWRFTDVDGAWRVSLATDFIALETTAYTSRDDFISRMRTVLEAVEKHLEPAITQRLGLRYIDQIKGDALENIANLVRSEMLGLVNTPLFRDVQHSISESLLDVPDDGGQLRTRWGYLPANASVDQSAMEPIDAPSWILDIDMFSEQQHPFASDQLAKDLSHFAGRIYSMFRWSVTDEFLRRYGGKP